MKKILTMLIVLLLVLSILPKQEVSAAGFTDVKSTHGFYGEIMFLLEKGVINSGTSFGVDQKVTREEVAVMVSKAVGLKGGMTTTPFKDVPSSLASSGYIKSAVDAGVLSGYTDGTFRPKEIVNRGQMAIFLANAFKLTTESNNNFKDMSPSMSSYSSVKKIVHLKITTGFSDNTFRPTETLTRGQISAFLARAMGYEKVAVTPTPSPVQTGFANCTEMRKVYPNGVASTHPAYELKHDRDKDNWACEL
ncbi:S-layer homology domain-containing protein [Paenisporosarcina sp. TG20]|uniref:S-layer homology domain-containing protein n=1 Tax=Paenisporosarcina sp. TG20 TaxID=1211706 RepID=UPI0002DE40D7|nr:S-layer homology domain-containing protein [Paenisporosarcina sp. TG20]